MMTTNPSQQKPHGETPSYAKAQAVDAALIPVIDLSGRDDS